MNPINITLIGGRGSSLLAVDICGALGIAPAKAKARSFSEGNIFVKVDENIRGREVFIVQSTSEPVNDNFMELLFWIDACKRASAASVTAIMPWFSYAKGDKKDEPRVAIRARVCADAIEAAGADRVITMDVHAPQIQGFFRIPVDDLRALPILCEAIRPNLDHDSIVVSPDAGFAKRARDYANRLALPLAIANKNRRSHDEHAEILEIIGDVEGKTAVLVDDFTISGQTLIAAAEQLIEKGARRVLAAVTHGVFNPGAQERIDNSVLEKLIVTDTVAMHGKSRKIDVVSVASLIAEAIRRIHKRQSLSILFQSGAPLEQEGGSS